MIVLPEAREDRLESFKGILQRILPTFEYGYFEKNTLGYVSANFVFRGMSIWKYKRLLSERYITPKSWDLAGWEAIFTTNKLSEALGYVENNKSWAIAIIPRKSVEWRTNFRSVLIGSTRYDKIIADLLSKEVDRAAVYTIDNRLDLERRQSKTNWDHRMLMIREPQDYKQSWMRFIVWDWDNVFLD